VEETDIPYLSDILNFVMGTDVIFSMKTTQKIQQSRKIFLRIKNLKYDLISHQLLNNMKVNKTTLDSIGYLLKHRDRKYIMYSIISHYDRTYIIGGHQSPTGVLLDVNQNFLDKFKIDLDYEEDLKID
jgi:hypothetical protein